MFSERKKSFEKIKHTWIKINISQILFLLNSATKETNFMLRETQMCYFCGQKEKRNLWNNSISKLEILNKKSLASGNSCEIFILTKYIHWLHSPCGARYSLEYEIMRKYRLHFAVQFKRRKKWGISEAKNTFVCRTHLSFWLPKAP